MKPFIDELIKAHEHYLMCSPAQRLWVLKNCPERLYMPGTNPIAITKQIRPSIVQLERHLAMQALPLVFAHVKSVSIIKDTE